MIATDGWRQALVDRVLALCGRACVGQESAFMRFSGIQNLFIGALISFEVSAGAFTRCLEKGDVQLRRRNEGDDRQE